MWYQVQGFRRKECGWYFDILVKSFHEQMVLDVKCLLCSSMIVQAAKDASDEESVQVFLLIMRSLDKGDIWSKRRGPKYSHLDLHLHLHDQHPYLLQCDHLHHRAFDILPSLSDSKIIPNGDEKKLETHQNLYKRVFKAKKSGFGIMATDAERLYTKEGPVKSVTWILIFLYWRR